MEKLKTKKQNELKIDRKTIKTMERPTCRDNKKTQRDLFKTLTLDKTVRCMGIRGAGTKITFNVTLILLGVNF